MPFTDCKMKPDTKLRRLNLRIAAIMLSALSLASCNGVMYDEEGDCDPHYKARFIFDMNMLYADAFSKEVNAVTLYLIDPATGDIVWQKSERGDRLRQDGYLMDLDVAPGSYQLLAWCGEGRDEHFTIPADASHHTQLTCRLNREYDPVTGVALSRKDLKRLYHGKTDVKIFPEEEGTYIYNVELVKNTNDVNIVLQHLSGEIVKEGYTFTITDANGSLDWDNSIMPDEEITYQPWQVLAGTAGIEYPEADDVPVITTMSACVANLTVSRLMADRSDDMRVKIYNPSGEKIVDIPLIQYALLVRGRYEHTMTEQEYLDRQDKYDLVFFIDEGNRWADSYIYINSWMVVRQSSDL